MQKIKEDVKQMIKQDTPSGKEMEDWEDYDDKSKTYTAMRQPVGLQHMLHFFGKGDSTDCSGLVLLDAGCGTGNYLVQMVDKFAKIHAGDFNGGMLSEAKANLFNEERVDNEACRNFRSLSKDEQAELVKIAHLNICDMNSLPSNTFDCSINCQVIHHLPKNQDITPEMEAAGKGLRYESVHAACREWYRVLKPGGKFCMNFVTHHQQMNGVWWGELIAEGVSRWQANAPDQCDINNALLAAGFKEEDIKFEAVRPLDEKTLEDIPADKLAAGHGECLYNPENFFNVENFIDIQNFRRSDSTFTLATEEELAAAVGRVKKMKADGTLQAWFELKEKVRAEIGQTTMLYVTKSL